MEDLKRMSRVFWTACAGIAVCLGGTVYTAVQRHKETRAMEAAVGLIPVPAFPGQTTSRQNPAPIAPGFPVPAR
jgi:hypothetical protein